MKSNKTSTPLPLPRSLFTLLFGVAAAALAAIPQTTHAGEIFVGTANGFDPASGTVGAYDSTTGAPINPSLVTGLGGPFGVAVSGTALYIADNNAATIREYSTSGTPINTTLVTGLNSPAGLAISGPALYVGDGGSVGEYDAVTGATINAPFVPSLAGPFDVKVFGSALYEANSSDGTVGEYDATTGAPINATFISGLSDPRGLALSDDGSILFVLDIGTNIIGEYNAATGAPINASLVTGLPGAEDIAVLGSDLFVANFGAGSISEYDTSGNLINPALVTGLDGPLSITVVAPEPSTCALLATTAAFLFARRRKS